MTKQSAPPQSVVVRLGASRSITVGPGSMVLIRHGERDSYGAVITSIRGCSAYLTFTPPGKPRRVPLGMILCAVDPGSGPATLDLSSVPRDQPSPTVAPQRSRRAVADV